MFNCIILCCQGDWVWLKKCPCGDSVSEISESTQAIFIKVTEKLMKVNNSLFSLQVVDRFWNENWTLYSPSHPVFCTSFCCCCWCFCLSSSSLFLAERHASWESEPVSGSVLGYWHIWHCYGALHQRQPGRPAQQRGNETGLDVQILSSPWPDQGEEFRA